MPPCPIPTVNLLEIQHADSGLSQRVDATSGVIRGVKVLGLQSSNTGRTLGLDPAQFGPAIEQPYEYTLPALHKAATLYESVGVYVDHPESTYSPDGTRRLQPRERKTAERFGRLKHVRVTEQGLFADLEFLTTHPLAPLVCEAARRMPEMLALSHHAQARPVVRDGRLLIDEITAVRSVDIIGERPGTTRSLFESEAETSTQTVENQPDRADIILECVVLLNEAGLPVRPSVLEALASLPDHASRLSLIEALPSLPTYTTPRSQSPTPKVHNPRPLTPADFIRSLRDAP